MIKKAGIIWIILIVFGFGTARNTHSSGFPVIDAAHIAQTITNYIQMLEDYAIQLEQLGVETDQYILLYDQYLVKLREFNHFLRQLQGIQHMIEAEEWDRILRVADDFFGKYYGSQIPQMNPESPTYDEDLDEVLEKYGPVPRAPEEVVSDASSVGIESERYREDVERDYRVYQRYKDQMAMVANNRTESDIRKETIGLHGQIGKKLGDDSHLATMQHLAFQNQTIMNQNEAMIQVLNQMLFTQELQESREAAKRADWREKELKRLKNRKPTPGLGRDRWGDL